MDTMYKLGRKVTFSKEWLDLKLGAHDEAFYDEERFITISQQRYALRGRSRTEESSWDYNEVFEVTRDQVTAYHITTDYQDMMEQDLEERKERGEITDKEDKPRE